MKINALTAAAVGLAGLALFAYVRKNQPARPVYDDPGVLSTYGAATAQRQASGAAVPQNTAYLQNWSDLSNAWGNDPNAWL